MFLAYVVVTVITIVINAWESVINFARTDFVLANAAAVGFPQSGLPLLGALKGAGALGLLLGMLGFTGIGAAAGVGLVLFFLCAMWAHVRIRDYRNLGFPGAFLAMAAGSLVLLLVR
ncbi:DoxX family protein [Streptomyces sp. NA04227]|uniref:DoxX family protein n=1 Tax=Streptomyces sp. NA04227 TaxID=2742136 RepID=UPI00158FD42C|nr:DoxX family protein [Streptomyces sp. NA04227]QKW09753.1 DoxX family protein [Streptomyces sp. NA04227]